MAWVALCCVESETDLRHADINDDDDGDGQLARGRTGFKQRCRDRTKEVEEEEVKKKKRRRRRGEEARGSVAEN